MFITNVVSAKILAQLNGLSAKCATPPLAPKQPKTMTLYAKPLSLPNLGRLLPRQIADPICHHVAIMILTLLTMLTTIDDPHASTAAPLASHTVVLAVVTAMIIIIANVPPQVTTTATMLAIMIVHLLSRIRLLKWRL